MVMICFSVGEYVWSRWLVDGWGGICSWGNVCVAEGGMMN